MSVKAPKLSQVRNQMQGISRVNSISGVCRGSGRLICTCRCISKHVFNLAHQGSSCF